MPEPMEGPWRLPPERAKTRAELRASPAEQNKRGTTMRIGEVAERLGLSLRSIRYYEEAGLVAPSARTQGGFRLYTEPDVSRLLLIMQMKPLGFSLEEMGDVFVSLDALQSSDSTPQDAAGARAGLVAVLTDVEQRLELLRARIGIAESFQDHLRAELADTDTGTDA